MYRAGHISEGRTGQHDRDGPNNINKHLQTQTRNISELHFTSVLDIKGFMIGGKRNIELIHCQPFLRVWAHGVSLHQ